MATQETLKEASRKIFYDIMNYNFDERFYDLIAICHNDAQMPWLKGKHVGPLIDFYCENFATPEELALYIKIKKNKNPEFKPNNLVKDVLYVPIFDELLRLSLNEQRFLYLDTIENKYRENLIDNITGYVKRKSDITFEEGQLIKKELHTILAEYTKYRKKKKKETTKRNGEQKRSHKVSKLIEFQEKITLMNKVADSNYQTSKEYCIIQQIDYNVFMKILDDIMIVDRSLFCMYANKMVAKMMDKKYGDEDLGKLLDLLINGVRYENGIHQFELLDYFMNTKVPLSELIELCKRVGLSDATRYLILLQKRSNMRDMVSLEVEMVKTDYITSGDGFKREVSNAEKRAAFEFMMSNNIPLYHSIYRSVLRREYLTRNKVLTR